jgi:hypothetical protein
LKHNGFPRVSQLDFLDVILKGFESHLNLYQSVSESVSDIAIAIGSLIPMVCRKSRYPIAIAILTGLG